MQAEWAQAAGLPVSIRYRSAQDNYDDTSVDEDGWQQYFEPVNAVWDPRHTVMLPCIGARMAFEQRHGPYAWQWRPLLQRRTLHAAATAVHSSMELQSQIPSPVAVGTRPTVPCQDKLLARFAVLGAPPSTY